MLSPAARITLPSDWRGTAEALAEKATEFLLKCGFDAKFGGSERLVRYYVTRGVLSPPEKDEIDRRKAVFGPLQFRQLVLTRLLAERGWDIDRIIQQLRGIKGAKGERELDELLNQLAEPTQAEKLLFKSRQEHPEAEEIVYSRPTQSIVTEAVGGDYPDRKPGDARESIIRRLVTSARGKDGGLDQLARTADRLLKEPGLTVGESAALAELAEMARLAFRQEGRKERWTRVKLAPWCEVNLRIGKESELSESQKSHMMREFKRIIEDYDSRLGL